MDVCIRGSNKYREAELAIYLGAARWKPSHVKSIEALAGRQAHALDEARHVENIYQFSMRTRLRVDPLSNVKLVVPTKKDATELAKRLGIKSSEVRKL